MEIVRAGIRYLVENGIATALGFASYEDETEALKLPSTVSGYTLKSIHPSAFRGCQFKELVLPNSICEIGANAFSRCTNLKIVKTAQRKYNPLLLTVKEYAFFGCTKLTTVRLHRNLVLSHHCFAECKVLQQLDSINQSSGNPFEGCLNLKSMMFCTDANFLNTSFEKSGINTIIFLGNAHFDEVSLNFIQASEIKIECQDDSNLQFLSYVGGNVEIVERLF